MECPFVVPGMPWRFVTRCTFAFRVDFFDHAFLLLVLLLLCLPSDNAQHNLQPWSLIRIPDIRKPREYIYISVFFNKVLKHICVLLLQCSHWYSLSALSSSILPLITRIVIVEIAFRQCAAWPSTLITHKHSRQKKTTEIYLYIFYNKRVKHICPIYYDVGINIRISCWVLRSRLFNTRIDIVVLVIRQCAARPSTLITHNHST